MIKHINFQVDRAYSDIVIWENRQLAAYMYINKQIRLSIHPCPSKEMCLGNNVL